VQSGRELGVGAARLEIHARHLLLHGLQTALGLLERAPQIVDVEGDGLAAC